MFNAIKNFFILLSFIVLGSSELAHWVYPLLPAVGWLSAWVACQMLVLAWIQMLEQRNQMLEPVRQMPVLDRRILLLPVRHMLSRRPLLNRQIRHHC
jgi:hypothetical protein